MNEKFIKALHASGLSMYAFSKQTGIPYTTINELVNKKKDINRRPAELLFRIAVALQCPVEDLLNPVHIMENISGKYRRIHYIWKYNSCMILVLKDKDKEKEISTGCQMTIPERKKAYELAAEIIIDQYLEDKAFEEKAASIIRELKTDE